MTFVPNQQPQMGMSPTVRTILFWVLMVALATVLWRMSSSGQGKDSGPSSSMSYSDFMAQVDKNNVSSVLLIESPSTAEVEGQLREPPGTFRTTVPKETIPALTEQLRKQGVPIEVSQDNTTTWPRLILNLLPFLLILGAWIFMMAYRMRRGSGQNPPPSATTPTIPSNRPIG